MSRFMNAPIDPSLLDRYLAGECSPAEIAHVEEWIAQDPERRNLDSIRFQGAPERTEAAWNRVSARLGRRALARPSRIPPSPRRTPLRFWSPSRSGLWAAAGAVAVILSVWLWPTRPTTEQSYRFATGAAQLTTVRLADGSRVTLAPHTTLLVDKDFGARNRTIRLVGEAFFDVTSTKQIPFIVYANQVQTRVLGTSFSVRRYPDDSSTRVTVATGRVAVTGYSRGKEEPPMLVLSKGMIGTVTASSAVAQTGWDVQAATAWMDGVLTFNDTPVPEVLKNLEHWYGVTFALKDSVLRSRHLSATFSYRTIGEVLEALQGLLNVSTSMHQDTVILQPKASPTVDPRILQKSE
jgi:transmembrane sensor